jgi:hypothetical protein
VAESTGLRAPSFCARGTIPAVMSINVEIPTELRKAIDEAKFDVDGRTYRLRFDSATADPLWAHNDIDTPVRLTVVTPADGVEHRATLTMMRLRVRDKAFIVSVLVDTIRLKIKGELGSPPGAIPEDLLATVMPSGSQLRTATTARLPDQS